MNLDKGKAPESMYGSSDSEKLENETPLPSRAHNSLELLRDDPLLRMGSFQDIFDGLPDLHQQILGAGSSSFDQPPPPASGELTKGEQSHQSRQGSGEKALRMSLSEEIDDELSEQRRRRQQHDHQPLSRKRTRSAEIHSKSEKRRRERLKEKVNTLRELIPQCDKQDRASVLEDAIEYLKALKLQVQVWSAARFQAPYASPAGMPSTQVGFPTFVPMRPTAQAIPMSGLYRTTAFPAMPFAPSYLYPSLFAATTGGLHLNPANFPAAANFQAPCFPSEPISAAPAVASLLLTTSDASAGVSTNTISNYSFNRGESSSRTTVNSRTNSQQVIPSSQDQTGVPRTQALQFAWSR